MIACDPVNIIYAYVTTENNLFANPLTGVTVCKVRERNGNIAIGRRVTRACRRSKAAL
jgi:hypothetical protein